MARIITPYYGSNTTISGGQNNTITTTTGSYNTAIGSSSLGIYGTSFNTTIAKTKYHILGEEVEVSGYIDGTTAMMISTLNVLGKPYYDELKKNNVSFSNEIEDFLKQKFKILQREDRIDSILDEKKSIEPPTF
jgi:hypothetical protein